jgi:hypothetical protein
MPRKNNRQQRTPQARKVTPNTERRQHQLAARAVEASMKVQRIDGGWQTKAAIRDPRGQFLPRPLTAMQIAWAERGAS